MGNSVNSVSKPATPNKSSLSVPLPIYNKNYFELFEYSDWYPICLEYIHQGKETGSTQQPMVKRKTKDIFKNTGVRNNCLFDWLERDKNDDRRCLLYQPSIDDDNFAVVSRSQKQTSVKPEPVGIYKKLIVQPENDYQQAIITQIREVRKYLFVIQKELRTSRFISVSVKEVEACLDVLISNLEKLRDYLIIVPKFLQHSKEYEKGISRYLEGMAEYHDSLEWLACSKYGFYSKD